MTHGTAASITSSRPDAWTHPRPHTDASQRYRTYGAIQPMEYDDTGSPVLRRWLVALAIVSFGAALIVGVV